MASASGPDVFSAHLALAALAELSNAAIELEVELEAFDAGHSTRVDVESAWKTYMAKFETVDGAIRRPTRRLLELVEKTRKRTIESPPRLSDRRRGR